MPESKNRTIKIIQPSPKYVKSLYEKTTIKTKI